MKLVIDISEKTYKKFKNLNQIIGILSFEKDTLDLIKAVKNATPLEEYDSHSPIDEYDDADGNHCVWFGR